jgi:hypothetical protein
MTDEPQDKMLANDLVVKVEELLRREKRGEPFTPLEKEFLRLDMRLMTRAHFEKLKRLV